MAVPLKEADIRRGDLLKRYQELALQDARKMDPAEFILIPCPGCAGAFVHSKFGKNGFQYVQCDACGSVFCSPRPAQEALNEFYEKGESSHYWATVFFPSVSEARREKLFRRKAEAIAALMQKEGVTGPLEICDAGAGHGMFLEELQTVFPNATLHAVELGEDMAEVCRSKGFETLETFVEDSAAWADRFDLVISSEVIEHVFSPDRFVKGLFTLAKPGGRVVLTGLGYEGFDILTLQENSNSVFPPHHINFLSVQGFEALFRRAGFSDVAVWTPGELDVDIVKNSDAAPGPIRELIRVLEKRAGGLEALQKFLNAQRLSSHVWVRAIKAR